MKPGDVARELAFPLTNMAVALAIVTFALLLSLAAMSRITGIWLGVVIVPAFFRYALYLLEARSQGRMVPPPGIESFSLVENAWALFSAVLPAFFIWANWQILSGAWPGASSVTAAGLLVLFLIVYPASMAVLALTRSPVQSLNPVALWRVVRESGADFASVPATTIPVAFLVVWLAQNVDLPFLVLDVAFNYAFLLIFTMTGAVLHRHGLADEVDVEMPLEQTPEEAEEQLLAGRTRVANHAYGFISRGNRDGGFAHIHQWLAGEVHRDQAYEWFFREMLRWETTLPALFFAQDYLHQLLGWDLQHQALKLISRCLHENPDWKPAEPDRAAVRALIERHGRADLERQLRM